MEDISGDELAEEVMKAFVEFDLRLHAKGRFPNTEFRAFIDTVERYVKATKENQMIHRSVARAVNGLGEILELESSRASGREIADADRLECMLFGGWDPYSNGDEPPHAI